MVLWQAEISVSRSAQCVSLLLHGVVIALVVLTPWPTACWLPAIALLVRVIHEAISSWQRNMCRQGHLFLLDDGSWRWDNTVWQPQKALPLCFSWGVCLTLVTTQRRLCFWLMRDSMTQEKWRTLRAYMAQHRG